MNARSGYLILVLCLGLFLSGCATLSRRIEPPLGASGDGGFYLTDVPPVAQKAYQCGPAALASVLQHWGKSIEASQIAETLYKPGTHGVLDFTLSEYARSQGFWTQMREGHDLEELKSWIHLNVPPIVMLKSGFLWVPNYHFVVLRGWNEKEHIFYANVGETDVHAIDYSSLMSRWKATSGWYLLICPPESVDWQLNEKEALDLALYCEKQGKTGLAEKWYQAALEKNPQNVQARFNLGNIYIQTNQWEQAKALYESLLKEKPYWTPAVNNLAWIDLTQKHPREAIQRIEEAFAHGAEKSPDILDTLAMAHKEVQPH